MKVTFQGQPFLEFYQTGALLMQWLEESDAGNVAIATAWAKRSGLIRLQPGIETFRRRGGHILAIIGVDQGGATRQGLELAHELFDEVHIFHELSNRTYHPKVYFMWGGHKARLIVGSNNMTRGGLFDNYEAALVCELDMTLEDDNMLGEQVNRWFNHLTTDQKVCKRLDTLLLERLTGDPRYGIADEDAPPRGSLLHRRPKQRGDNADGDSRLFGTSSSRLRALSSLFSSRRGRVGRQWTMSQEPTSLIPFSEQPPLSQEDREVASNTAIESSLLPLRWVKRLSAADAQQPTNPNTNPTGSLKLTRAGQANVDQTIFFRDQMFGNAIWFTHQKVRGVLEETYVTMDVMLDGVPLGRMDFKIDHAMYRVANQRNVPTWLHWGPLRPALRDTNFTNAWVILERLTDGTHTLQLTWAPQEVTV